MISRLGHVLLIVALLGATGAHWALLQSVAWVNMLAVNARTEALPTAIAKTFDGKHPCALCKQVAQGRQCEKKSEFPGATRLDFLNQPASFCLTAPTDFRLLSEQEAIVPLLLETPPVPPPRASQG